jgi:hypothetical protein
MDEKKKQNVAAILCLVRGERSSEDMHKILSFRKKEILEALLSCRKVWSDSSPSATSAASARAGGVGDAEEDAGDIDKISTSEAEAQEAYRLVMETQTQACHPHPQDPGGCPTCCHCQGLSQTGAGGAECS